MSTKAIEPTGQARVFSPDEIIVSKTDTKGRITYANDVFCRVAQFAEHELIGQPHNIVRHPDMPRCVFKLLWDTLGRGEEIFALVKNMARNGDHYWVLAHVTPSFNPKGEVVGYHSTRRLPDPAAVAKIEPLYAALLAEENRHADRRAGMEASTAMLAAELQRANLRYDQLLFSLLHDAA